MQIKEAQIKFAYNQCTLKHLKKWINCNKITIKAQIKVCMAWYMQNYITFSNITPKTFRCPRSSFYDGKQNLHIISVCSVFIRDIYKNKNCFNVIRTQI